MKKLRVTFGLVLAIILFAHAQPVFAQEHIAAVTPDEIDHTEPLE